MAGSRLVIIGTDLDEGAIRQEFQSLPARPQPFLAMAFQVFRQGGQPFG